jgi:hypothetical protein
MQPAWSSRTSTDEPMNRRLIPAVSLSIFAVVLVVVFIASCFAPMKDDIAWLLYVARRWLGGRVLYQDLVEVNPPLIIWLSAIPSLLAHWISIPPKFIAILLFVGQSLASAWWTASILRRAGGMFSDRWSVFAAIGTVLLLLPGADLGQREHLLLAGFIPYLALSGLSLEGHPVSRWEGISAGVFAALFCALKPLYAACFVTVEVAMLLSGRKPWRSMPIAAVLTLMGYVILVVLLCPAYLRQAVPMALALYGATDVPFSDLFVNSASLLAGEALAIGLLAFRWRTLTGRNLMTILVLFAVTSTLVCFSDRKDWYYHRIPAVIATSLSLMVWASDEIRQRSWRIKPPLVAAIASILVFCVSSIRQLEPEFQAAFDPRQSVVERLESIVRAEHARTYMAFSEWIALGFPVVNNTGVTWASRFDSMWALKGEVWRQGFDRTAGKEWPIARWVAHDFIAGCPDIVVVDTMESLNYVNILSTADPAFARVWTRYKRIAAFDGLVVYKHALGGCLDVWVAAGVNSGIVTR